MPPTYKSARPILIAAALLASFVSPIRAQDADPGTEAPAAEKAPPKPRLKPKMAHPKTAPTAAPKQPPAPATMAASPHSALWPAGATTVSESYGDWTMTCVRPNEKAACVIAQSQGDSKTGRRRFGIEMKPPRDGRSEGIVVMPFGLAIEPGVTFKLDEQTLGKGAPYSSCTGEGCLVPVSFPVPAIDAMRSAKTLTVVGRKTTGATGIEAGDAATITVPLVGFPQAFDRATALGAY